MKCDVCRAIETLGLDESAHDLWYCADAGVVKTAKMRSRSYLHEIGRRVQQFARSHSRHYRMWRMAYHRPQLVTLEL